jgi:hypothetical protein
MRILERLGLKRPPQSLHEEPGPRELLTRADVEAVLSESCRCILNKDLDALSRLLAIGAEVEVRFNHDGVAKTAHWERGHYLAYVAAELARHSVVEYLLPIERVLQSSDRKWVVECYSNLAISANGQMSRARHRETVTVELANGHAVVTKLKLEVES